MTLSSPSIDDVMLLLGNVVYEAQETEATVHLTATLFFGLSIAQSIDQFKDVYSKKTLGQFHRLFRDKFGITEAFDTYLKKYIDQRNFIVHNFSRTSIFSIHTDEGRQKLQNLLTDFRYKNRKVHLTFIALTEVWRGMVEPTYKLGEHFKNNVEVELYKEIAEEFLPALKSFFTGKPVGN